MPLCSKCACAWFTPLDIILKFSLLQIGKPCNHNSTVNTTVSPPYLHQDGVKKMMAA